MTDLTTVPSSFFRVMDSLNFVNLIQAASVGVGLLGCSVLYRNDAFRGIALLFALTSLAATVNLFEESGVTRNLILISPVFIAFFGPATYLASYYLIRKKRPTTFWLHILLPLALLLIISEVKLVIAFGTLWRLVYAFYTVKLLVEYKKALDQERSDANEYSLHWLISLIIITALFNFVDLIRLNTQHLIPYSLNLWGQGINNFIWLVAMFIVTIKLLTLGNIPIKPNKKTNTQNDAEKPDEYKSIFKELDALIQSNRWYSKPRLTLAQLSELTGLQTRDISRAINLVTSQSFNDYINAYRVNDVCLLLDNKSSLPLTDIWLNAGFSSKASFNKAFKSFKGVTPTVYKQINSI